MTECCLTNSFKNCFYVTHSNSALLQLKNICCSCYYNLTLTICKTSQISTQYLTQRFWSSTYRLILNVYFEVAEGRDVTFWKLWARLFLKLLNCLVLSALRCTALSELLCLSHETRNDTGYLTWRIYKLWLKFWSVKTILKIDYLRQPGVLFHHTLQKKLVLWLLLQWVLHIQ
jgi:hypothetical protein